MTHAELAKKIREAVYDRANYEGGAISKEQMDDAIEGALAKAMPMAPTPAYPGHAVCLADTLTLGIGTYIFSANGDVHSVRIEEWR